MSGQTTKRKVLSLDYIRKQEYSFRKSDGLLMSGSYSWTESPRYTQQVTVSEGHAWPSGRARWDQGGPFDTVRTGYRNPYLGTIASYVDLGNGPVQTVRNWTPVPDPFSGVPSSIFTSEQTSITNMASWTNGVLQAQDLTALGSSFIADTIPTNPVVDGAVGLAEFYREGLPSMIGVNILKDRAAFMRALGSEYLNIEFGWKPLIADVRNASRAVIESEKILSQLARDSGKNVKRRRYLPVEFRTTVKSNTSSPWNTNNGNFYGTPWFRETDTSRQETWFSGCYTFHYEEGKLNQLSEIATKARLLYGLKLDPEVLWNLTPWSWLIDWVANVGDVLHNVYAFQQDGLVLRYGYVMEQTTRHVTRSVDVNPNATLSGFPSRPIEEFAAIRKRRVKATPFGFGITSNAFTTRQWTILGALGMTLGSRSLKN